MKLLIGIPTMDYVHVDFLKCLMRLVLKLKDDSISFDVDIVAGSLVYSAREQIANKAINEGYTHVLWLDSDMVFGEDILDDLMFCGKQIVSGIYHTRKKGYISVIFKSIDPDKFEWFEEYPNEPFRIAGCGFGCVLTDTEVLRSVQQKFGMCFFPIPRQGEDLAFCKRAQDLGFELWCDPTVVCGHIGHIAIYPEDHEAWKKTISNL